MDGYNPQRQLLEQTRQLVKKWEPTGLLENLEDENKQLTETAKELEKELKDMENCKSTNTNNCAAQQAAKEAAEKAAQQAAEEAAQQAAEEAVKMAMACCC